MIDRVANQLMDGAQLCLTIELTEFPEDAIVVARCVEIPGCISQGGTPAEAKANIADAIEACLSVMFEDAVFKRQALTASDRQPDGSFETIRVSLPQVLRCA